MPSAIQRRALYARTNMANKGFKDNTPGGWVSTNGPVWWVGSDNAYAVLRPQRAGLSAITRAINIITNPIAAADWTVDGATPRWISDPMLTRPDDRYEVVHDAYRRVPRSVFWGSWLASALSWGMGYLVFIPSGASDEPLAGSLWLWPPDQVEPDTWTGVAKSPNKPPRRAFMSKTDSTPRPISICRA